MRSNIGLYKNTGEFADVIAIKVRETVVEVLLCHCKYASTHTGAARLDDVYEVAGQSLKSVQFCQKPKRIIRNMINRERRRQDPELPAKVVQERLGYSTIAMTLDIYGDLFPRHDDSEELAAAERALLD